MRLDTWLVKNNKTNVVLVHFDWKMGVVRQIDGRNSHLSLNLGNRLIFIYIILHSILIRMMYDRYTEAVAFTSNFLN